MTMMVQALAAEPVVRAPEKTVAMPPWKATASAGSVSVTVSDEVD